MLVGEEYGKGAKNTILLKGQNISRKRGEGTCCVLVHFPSPEFEGLLL